MTAPNAPISAEVLKVIESMEWDAVDIRLGRQWMSACEHYAPTLRAAVASMAEREAALVAERDSLRKRNREMCQALVNAVGADGPCNAEDAAAKLVSERDALRAKISKLEERYTEQGINARASSQAAHEARVELSSAIATIALLEAQNAEMRTYFENALRADIDRYHSCLERKDLP